MDELIRGIVLGAIQGITEFFPVSSSGHLILVPWLFGWDDQGLSFDTVLHLGTLVALLWVFRGDLRALASGVVQKSDPKSKKLVAMILVATIPGVLAGGLLGGMIEATNRTPVVVAGSLAFWGIILLLADVVTRKLPRRVKEPSDMQWWQAILIGCSQAIAIVPGTSRSGITMTAGLVGGLSREAAVTFSFLLSIPTVAAAGAYGTWKLLAEGVTVSAGIQLAVGFVVAAVTGAWAIKFLRGYVAKHSFAPFVIYRLILAAVILVAL